MFNFEKLVKENKSLNFDRKGLVGKDIKLLCDALMKFDNIIDLNLRYNYIDVTSLANFLEKTNTLTILNIGFTSLKNDEIKKICDALKDNKSLTNFNIEFNDVDLESIESLSLFIGNNYNLTDLNLSYLHIEQNMTKSLFEGLAKNKSLTKLNLAGNVINFDYFDLLNTNTNIKFLNLSENKIQNIHKAIKLFTYLELNNNLLSLNLKGTGVFCYISHLCKYLGKNKSLKRLNLSRHNLYGEKSFKLFFETLQQNHTLTYLNLNYNNSSTNIIKITSEFLKNNNSIEHFKMTCGDLSREKYLYLTQILETNYTLTNLDLGSMYVTDYTKLKRNKLYRHQRISLLLFARKLPQSFLYSEYFPLDLFKIIFKMCNFL